MKMKKLSLLIVAILFTVVSTHAQILNPVKWSVATKKSSNTEATVYIKATIDKGWHIYSQNVGEGGPVATSFSFTPSKDFTLAGKTVEPTPKSKYEDAFKMNVKFFEKEVIFAQKVKLKKGQTAVKGKVEFMVCDDSRCLPPDEYAFTAQIK
ncbi:protein-disulfide reductase DsbD domain-containing protein [Sphingobacterium spiritivorum]|uniref:protein-disulfide reductase DsbD domain-containing protein n=1 Tax=Sphingobacterium spiritivorum TaxID=258 RepID=UPI003DA69FB2